MALDLEPVVVESLRDEPDVEARLRDFVADGSGEPDASVDHVQLYNILQVDLARESCAPPPGSDKDLSH